MDVSKTPPTPECIRQARKKAGLTQPQAMALISMGGSHRTWQNYESPVDSPGHRAIPWASWTLFLLLTNQHPTLRVLPRKSEAT